MDNTIYEGTCYMCGLANGVMVRTSTLD